MKTETKVTIISSKKKLPRTKEEFWEFLVVLADHNGSMNELSLDTVVEFLKKYED